MANDIERGLTVEFVRACFTYDPDTGKLFWKVDSSGRRGAKIGDEAGDYSKHYPRVQVFGRMFSIHRIAWAAHYGRWPDGFIDHINGDGADNRISNLRECSHQQNQANRPADKDSSSKFKGVDWMPRHQKWRARVGTDHLGVFASEEDAAAAYDQAALTKWGAFARLNLKENSLV